MRHPNNAAARPSRKHTLTEIRRHAIYDNRPYEKKARVLLEAYDQMDPDGVLLALTGRRLYEHEAAAGLWKEDKQEDKP